MWSPLTDLGAFQLLPALLQPTLLLWLLLLLLLLLWLQDASDALLVYVPAAWSAGEQVAGHINTLHTAGCRNTCTCDCCHGCNPPGHAHGAAAGRITTVFMVLCLTWNMPWR
jgi:hypothetical protein